MCHRIAGRAELAEHVHAQDWACTTISLGNMLSVHAVGIYIRQVAIQVSILPWYE